MLAIALVILWAVSGPIFGWSDPWQLVINAGTTIVTFLMVFVIQNMQSRDTRAMQIKLDELIRANEVARKVAFAALASGLLATSYYYNMIPSQPFNPIPCFEAFVS